MRYSVTDLHTHILPSVDDGAASIEISMEMLSVQKEKGIDRLALTPHYYPNRETLDSFINRRQTAYDALKSCLNDNTMPQLCLGAEVRYSPQLTRLDLDQLTIGASNYLLLELPDKGAVPLLVQVVDAILCRNIIPVFAHIERCDMFRKEPELLLQLVQRGALAQVTASAMSGRPDSFASACFNNGLAHIISSDAHEPDDCVDFTTLKYHNNIVPWAEAFSRAIWEGTPLPAFSILPVKKGLLGYR